MGSYVFLHIPCPVLRAPLGMWFDTSFSSTDTVDRSKTSSGSWSYRIDLHKGDGRCYTHPEENGQNCQSIRNFQGPGKTESRTAVYQVHLQSEHELSSLQLRYIVTTLRSVQEHVHVREHENVGNRERSAKSPLPISMHNYVYVFRQSAWKQSEAPMHSTEKRGKGNEKRNKRRREQHSGDWLFGRLLL